MQDDDIRITPMGPLGLLLDVAGARMDSARQRRIHAVAAALRAHEGVSEVVPGMNNLMVELTTQALPQPRAEALLRQLWQDADPDATTGKLIEIPVTYGGPEAEDFDDWLARTGLEPEEAIARHAGGTYEVAALGAMPGFGYLSGLDPALALPRREVPRGRVPKGAVIIGGAQAAVMPITAPSGWHIIGMTDVTLFDPAADPPCLMAPGDRVRFVQVAR